MVRMRNWLVALAVFVGLVGVPLAPAWAGGSKGKKAYNPVIRPRDFTTEIDNKFMPLVPGTTFVYEGETADGFETNEVQVTDQTKTIMGVTCVVVWDRAWVDDELVEETWDWYAQDKHGNVWYFGEAATQIEGGVVVGTEGSWEAGVDGALPGIVMEGHPRPGDTYRQEYYVGVAEDMAKVLRLNARVSVAYGCFHDCLKTKEWSSLDPGAVEFKYYAPDVGLVLITSGSERVELVSVTGPGADEEDDHEAEGEEDSDF